MDITHSDVPKTARNRSPRISSFDRAVWGVMAVIVAAILLTIVLGDRVGVTLRAAGPLGEARSTSRITLEFSEPMQRDSVTERFRTEPALQGEFSWAGNTLIFTPADAMTAGEAITVTLASGAQSENGRSVLSDYQFAFTVRSPEVAYLAPANGSPQNIWVVSASDPESARQLTFSPSGIYDFSVSPDGSQIAFSENNSDTGTQDLKLLTLATGGIEQITNCVDSACTNPVWRPDGSGLIYERVELNSDMAQQGVGTSPTRVWTLDLTSRPVQTRPLFSDLQLLGHSPQISADGSRIALYDSGMGSILIQNTADGSLLALPSRAGSSGGLSPDGTRLIYPEVILADGARAHSYLRMANLIDSSIVSLSDPPQQLDDARAQWRPDGRRVAIARRDESVMRGYQIYLLDPLTGEAQQITQDPRYTNMYFWWDPTGRYLVVHRFPELDENMQSNMNGLPEIWTLDTETGAMLQLAINGFLPRWLP